MFCPLGATSVKGLFPRHCGFVSLVLFYESLNKADSAYAMGTISRKIA